MEELVLAGSGADAFEAAFALVVARLVTELNAPVAIPKDDPFRDHGDDQRTAAATIALVGKVAAQWPGVIDPLALNEFRPAQLAECVRVLAPWSLANAGFGYRNVVEYESLKNRTKKASK